MVDIKQKCIFCPMIIHRGSAAGRQDREVADLLHVSGGAVFFYKLLLTAEIRYDNINRS